FRPLEDEGATRADSRASLADRLVEREVPGRERSTHPNRLPHHQLAHIGIARGHHPPIDAPRFFSVPLGMLGAHLDFCHGFGQGFALVHREIAADFVGAFPRQFAHPAQNATALQRRGVPPLGERPIGGGNRAIQVFAAGVWQLSDDFARGGVDDVLLLAGFENQLSVDIQRQFFVHETSLGSAWIAISCRSDSDSHILAPAAGARPMWAGYTNRLTSTASYSWPVPELPRPNVSTEKLKTSLPGLVPSMHRAAG